MTKKESVKESDSVEGISTGKLVGSLVLFAAIIIGAFWLMQPGPSDFELNGFYFEQVACERGQCYETVVQTNIGVHPITFYSDPREVADIPVDREAVVAILNLTRSRNTSVTIAFDEGVPGEVGVAASLLARVTGERLYNISTSGGVYGEDVVCSQSDRYDRVVYITQTDDNGVFMSNSCIIVTASDVDNLVSVVDAYVMRLLLIL